ncbi:MAG: DNA translocase FtsK [bacterium]|nr:DNA translocase FtsK [bacterium]MDY4101028.1 DNA translocase FtsK [Lachnospiraceae bacterium]
MSGQNQKNRKKTTTTNRKGTASAGNSKAGKASTSNTSTQMNDNVVREVILWVMLAVSIVLFVSNFGIGGKVGDLLSSFLFGVCGLMAYIFPILLFVGTVFVLSNGKNRIAVIKVIAAILFVCFLCLFLELVSGVSEDYSPVSSYVHGMTERNGGGFLGGLFAWMICPNFGRVSAYVIDFIVLIITMVVVTERSAWKHVQKGGMRMYESAKEGNERLHEMQVQRKEERAMRRMERKVSGVSSDTKLMPDRNGDYVPSDALTEITPESFARFPNKKKSSEPVAEALMPGLPELMNDTSQLSVSEPAVTAKRQVNLEPVSGPEMDGLEPEPMSVFSPELQKLFAQAEPEPVTDPEASTEPGLSYAVLPEVLPPAETEIRMEPEAYVEPEPVFEETVASSQTRSITDEKAAPTQEKAAEKPLTEKPQAPVKNPKMDAAEAENEMQAIADEIEQQSQMKKTYVYPPVDLLRKGNPRQQGDSKQHLQQTALKLQQTLKNFGVNVTISNVSCGPTVTRYEIQPEMGVKVSKIVNLTDDIKLNLAAADIRMEAPIPGKAAIGIEVPNKETLPVMFRDLIESDEFKQHPSNIAFAAGRDIGGQVIMADIAKMPHLLIAGATGSGKSVCINTIIMSLLYRADPEDVKLILIDPKVVELSVYNGIPHLFIPVVTDPKKAAGALNWAVAEMTERYQKFATYGVRDLKGYNAKVESIADIDDPEKPKKLPQIVIIVDELADLMMVAPGDVEDAICRLAQLARACGIHLIIATQRPSVNVITGLIKANMPSRIAFSVTSGVDSRTILDMVGAEKLLGKGDCLYYPQGLNKPLRVQGAFVSDQEVSDVVDFIKDSYGHATYDDSIEEKMSKISESTGSMGTGGTSAPGNDAGGRDTYFVDAAKLLMDKDKASIGMLQRYFKIGFNRAARIMDQLEEAGVVGPEEGTKPRQILMSPETFDSLLEDGSF